MCAPSDPEKDDPQIPPCHSWHRAGTLPLPRNTRLPPLPVFVIQGSGLRFNTDNFMKTIKNLSSSCYIRLLCLIFTSRRRHYDRTPMLVWKTSAVGPCQAVLSVVSDRITIGTYHSRSVKCLFLQDTLSEFVCLRLYWMINEGIGSKQGA